MNVRSGFLVIVLIVAFAGCSQKPRADAQLGPIKAYAKAEVTIERLRKQKEPNWNAIGAQYEITSATVKNIDKIYGKNYNAEIRQALEKCAAGQEVKVNQQTLAKGLQHITVLAITKEFDEMANAVGADRKMHAERIKAYFEGIRPTFIRRDTDFFGDSKTLETAADQALEHLLKTATGNFLTARRQLEDVINRTYALCVLFEIMDIEKLRDKDLAKCDVKKAEAVIFYRIIAPRIKKRSSKTDEMISNMLNENYATMNAATLERNLETGLKPIILR